MKPLALILVAILLLYCSNISGKEMTTNTVATDTLSITTTQEMYNLTNEWASNFGKQNPSTIVKVTQSNDNDVAGMLKTGTNLCIVSNENYSGIKNEFIWQMIVGRNAIVPIINSKNPNINLINEQGVAPKNIAHSLFYPDVCEWSTLLKNCKNAPLKYYMINNRSIRTIVANFLKINKPTYNLHLLSTKNEIIAAVQNDVNAIGFCKLSDIVDGNNFTSDITVLPIDRNENGKIDYSEKIYGDLQSFMRGVWIGKYPKELSNNIYAVMPDRPKDLAELTFLKWIITDGQQLMNKYGYSDLTMGDVQTKLELLGNNQIMANATSETSPQTSIIAILGYVIILMLIGGLLLSFSQKKRPVTINTQNFITIFDEKTLDVPNGIYFDKTHTWTFLEKNGTVKVGIDDFMQHTTGKLTRIKMKNAGDKVNKGETFVTIAQNGKQLNICSPVSGTIKMQNEMLNTNPSAINKSPYTDGWIYAIEPSNWLREVQFYSMADKYKEWIKNEFMRLKDFMAMALKQDELELAHIVLQDGGVLTDNPLANLDPEVWEEFQTNFIDTSK